MRWRLIEYDSQHRIRRMIRRTAEGRPSSAIGQGGRGPVIALTRGDAGELGEAGLDAGQGRASESLIRRVQPFTAVCGDGNSTIREFRATVSSGD